MMLAKRERQQSSRIRLMAQRSSSGSRRLFWAWGLFAELAGTRRQRPHQVIEDADIDDASTLTVGDVPGYRLELAPFGGIEHSGLRYNEGVQEAIKSFAHARTTLMPLLCPGPTLNRL